MAAIILLAPACTSDSDVDLGITRTVYGKSVPMGSGIAQSWVTLDAANNPVSIGVNLSKEAVHGFPEHSMAAHDMADDSHMGMIYYEVSLPDIAKAKTPYNHIGLDWNPMGHPPAFYQTPHFDAHFYMITPDVQQQIGNEMTDPKINIAPEAKYLPADYIDAQVNVPQMGKHWFDKFSPELNGGEFTQTFIYGTYDGQVAFLEPMFTLAYLSSRPNDTFPIKQPAEFARKGLYYPTTYTIRHNPRTDGYTISLDGMRLK